MRTRLIFCVSLLAFCSFFALLRVHSADEKKLAIFSPQANYSLSISEHDNQDYVAVFALMEPLAKTTLRVDNRTFRLQVNDIEGEFKEGKTSARIGKAKFDLDGKMIVENGHALVPLKSITRILSEYLKKPVEFHESAQRLFIDTRPIEFSSELKKGDPSRLVLTFSAPVSPAIHAEGNNLHLQFNRDPVTAGTGSSPLSAPINDKLLLSRDFHEANGSAELTVNGSAPLFATVSDGGKTVTITGAPAPATATTATAPTVTPTSPETATKSGTPTEPKPPAARPPMIPSPPHFFVLIDPGHGGQDPGAKLSDTLLEKDITLAFARKLRTELQNRGVPAVLTRDSDSTLSFDQRATEANSQGAAIYIGIHAATPGRGVRVFSAMLTPAAENKSPFLPWDEAQSPFVEKSRSLAANIVQQFADEDTHAVMASSPLRPLNNVAAIAIGIEIADPDPQVLTAPKLHQSIAMKVAAGIVEGRAKLERSATQ